MEIPRLRLSAVVVEGVGPAALRRAVGHIPGTALPGGDGNVGIAGHRDTFFRPLKDLRVNDEIRFSTLRGNFKYEVESLTVVEPDNVGVLAPSHENVLTMVTCYPFSYIGAAPKRFIVRARQVWPRVLNRFGDSDGKKPLPGGRGSVNRAESTRLLPSRDRQGAVSPERLSTRPQAAPSTVAAVE
jgi:sortase A